MNNLKRLVAEEPNGNYQWLHNMTKIINKEVYLREYEHDQDLSIVEYCRRACLDKCDINIDAPVEEFGENMDCDCPISLIYHMAVGHAELRARLALYEDSGLSPSEVAELSNAKKEKDKALKLAIETINQILNGPMIFHKSYQDVMTETNIRLTKALGYKEKEAKS